MKKPALKTISLNITKLKTLSDAQTKSAAGGACCGGGSSIIIVSQ